MILNENVDFVRAASDQDQRAFTDTPKRILINDGTQLYRWTDTPLREGEKVSVWWLFALSTRLSNDETFEGFDERAAFARRLNKTHREYARVRLALSEKFDNNMKLIVRARLKARVWAFCGKVAGQHEFKKKSLDHVFFIGGSHQLWIPHLAYPEYLHLESNERVDDTH